MAHMHAYAHNQNKARNKKHVQSKESVKVEIQYARSRIIKIQGVAI